MLEASELWIVRRQLLGAKKKSVTMRNEDF